MRIKITVLFMALMLAAVGAGAADFEFKVDQLGGYYDFKTGELYPLGIDMYEVNGVREAGSITEELVLYNGARGSQLWSRGGKLFGVVYVYDESAQFMYDVISGLLGPGQKLNTAGDSWNWYVYKHMIQLEKGKKDTLLKVTDLNPR